MKKLIIIIILALFYSLSSFAQVNLDGKVFRIASAADQFKGMCIDADASSLGTNGTKVQLWACHTGGGPNQDWKFEKIGPDTYLIKSQVAPTSVVYLDADGYTVGNNGGKVQLWEDAASHRNQKWIVSKNADGTYRITAAAQEAKNRCLDADGYTPGKNGTKVQVWAPHSNGNQKWHLRYNTLAAGESLLTNDRLYSANGAYYLVMQSDGNLCVYTTNDGFKWCSMAHGFNGAKLSMQGDGNLVVYDGNGTAKWSSETHPFYNENFRSPENKPTRLVIENDGSLSLYTRNNNKIWTNK